MFEGSMMNIDGHLAIRGFLVQGLQMED